MNPLVKANAPSISKPRLWQTISLTTALVAVTNPVLACGFFPPNPPPPPPPVWIINHTPTEFWIGVELAGLTPPITAPTQCACGATILPGGIPLPASFQITDALVAITPKNSTTIGTEVVDGLGNPIFNFTPNTTIGNSLAADPWAVPGQTWNGFGAQVNPFTIPTLGTDEVFKLWFKATVADVDSQKAADALAANPNTFQFASGTFSDPNHPISYTGPTVPEPSAAISLLGLAGLMLLQGRRKS